MNIYTQFAPGKPQLPTVDRRALNRTREGWTFKAFPDVSDTASERLGWFKDALENLADMYPKLVSIAMPARIGCGLAGGTWFDYLQ